VKNSVIAKTKRMQDSVDRFLAEYGGSLPVDIEVEGIVDRIHGLSHRFKRSMEETLGAFGLSYGEWQLLSHLLWAGPPYRRTPGQLAKKAELSSGAMTNRLDGLEEAGLIRRLPDRDDRRAVQVELTRKGKRLWEKAVGAQAEKESLLASALSQSEKEELTGLLRRLMIAFEEREGPDKK
jgi:DNA-binding MarR family transcriptional regulator